jgi:UDP-N-acetylmuramoyl-tripeptide--D-alanyl-D-alanine ligase
MRCVAISRRCRSTGTRRTNGDFQEVRPIGKTGHPPAAPAAVTSAPVPLWTAPALAAVAGGSWVTGAPEDMAVYGIELMPGRVGTGDLFIVTSRARWGGKYADTLGSLPALRRKAAAAMTDRLPEEPPPDLPLLRVANTRQSLTRLAEFARARLAGRVIGVTGSVGKTTTREMLYHALGRQGRASATQANSNTSPGVALSVARTPAEADFAIYELAHGALARKSQISRPHVALITEVTLAHLDDFPTLDAIADHKAEIFDGLEPGGTAILNRDSRTFDRLQGHLDRREIANRLTFGRRAEADMRLLQCQAQDGGSRLDAEFKGERAAFRLPVAGLHMAMNAIAALAGIAALGGDWRRAAADLEDFAAADGRMAEIALPVPGGRVRLIDDAFNASPASMAAALSTMAAMTPPPGGRRIAVLGEMKELGAEAESLHAALAAPVLSAGLSRVFTLGEAMQVLRRALPEDLLAPHARSVDELEGLLRAALAPGDIVLVKGSHGSHVRQVVTRLRAGAPA